MLANAVAKRGLRRPSSAMKVSLAAVIFCWLSGSTACLAAVAAGSPAAAFSLEVPPFRILWMDTPETDLPAGFAP
ncbi:MAG TPA: hypothetical protein DCG00_07360 [Alistipes sp.]|nr:hypothetical protein [Alistipes sp.]